MFFFGEKTGASTTTAGTATTPQCAPGQHYDAAQCAACPPGHYCAGGAGANASATACPRGTANPTPGAADAAACVACAEGTHASAPGSAACATCPVGHYCEDAALPAAACPARTTSSAGSVGLGDCTCLPGFLCTYRREVRLKLALNTSLTLQALQSDASVAIALRDGVLTGLGLYGLPGISASFEGFTLLPA